MSYCYIYVLVSIPVTLNVVDVADAGVVRRRKLPELKSTEKVPTVPPIDIAAYSTESAVVPSEIAFTVTEWYLAPSVACTINSALLYVVAEI